MKTFYPDTMTVPEIHKLMVGGVAPRPIALISTLSEKNIPNLAPYSFFNIMSINPTMVAFSTTYRGSERGNKDTHNNLLQTRQCTISVVPHSLVQQINVSAVEFDAKVDEFEKTGLTPLASTIVKPARVSESPFHLECELFLMINSGGKPGAGNIAICKVLAIHIDESKFTEGYVDPVKMDLVGRMSADFYSRADSSSVFTVPRPAYKNCIGFEGLPEFVRNSKILTGNSIGLLANQMSFPTKDDVSSWEHERNISVFSDEIVALSKAGASEKIEIFIENLLNTSQNASDVSGALNLISIINNN